MRRRSSLLRLFASRTSRTSPKPPRSLTMKSRSVSASLPQLQCVPAPEPLRRRRIVHKLRMHASLRTFLDLLNGENEITTIKAEVDPYLELAEIHRRVIAEGGPALLFERVKGSRYPVVTNLFGTERRIDLAFGPKPEAFVRQMVHIAESILPPKFGELWQHRSIALELA